MSFLVCPSQSTDIFRKLTILIDNPDMQTELVSSHGMLAILEVLESKCSRDVTMKLLQMINLVRCHNTPFELVMDDETSS